MLLWWHEPLNLRDDNDKATKPTHFTCVGFSGMVGGNVNVLPKVLPSVIDIECCVSRFGLLRILLSWSYILIVTYLEYLILLFDGLIAVYGSLINFLKITLYKKIVSIFLALL